MGLFRDRWDSENYPSYEDYMDAKRNGTLKKYRQMGSTPSNSEKKANMSADSPYSVEPRQSSLESQTATIEAKSQAARDDRQKSDAKRYRNTDAKYGDSKPFASRLPNVQLDKKKQFKGLAILIAIVIGILPSFSKLMDSISNEINPAKWVESLNNETAVNEPSTATTEAVALTSNITTALPADHFVIKPATADIISDYSGIIDKVASGDVTSMRYGRTSENLPFVELQLKSGNVFPLSDSELMSGPEKSGYFNQDGTLLDTAYIELVFTNLTDDGLKELLVYYYGEEVNAAVEIFYNTGNEAQPYKVLNFFESYKTLNITDKGILQRIDDSGQLYDEIEVTEDGVYLVEE